MITENMSEEEFGWLAFNQALDALRAFVRGDARVLTDEEGEPIGVAWPDESLGCEEEIRFTM